MQATTGGPTNYVTEEVHISTIQPGDVIIHYGELKTVSGTFIKKDTFMGTTLYGDSYRSGYKKVTKVTFKLNDGGHSSGPEFAKRHRWN